jgi:hypothetical protein
MTRRACDDSMPVSEASENALQVATGIDSAIIGTAIDNKFLSGERETGVGPLAVSRDRQLSGFTLVIDFEISFPPLGGGH